MVCRLLLEIERRILLADKEQEKEIGESVTQAERAALEMYMEEKKIKG